MSKPPEEGLEKTEKSTSKSLHSPWWIYLLMFVLLIWGLLSGWFFNDLLAYFWGVVIVVMMVNDIKKLGLERGGHRWESLGQPLYLAIIVVSAVYVAFQNVFYVILSLVGFMALAGFIMFSPHGEEVKKHTVFKDKYLTLIVIAISIAAILIGLIL